MVEATEHLGSLVPGGLESSNRVPFRGQDPVWGDDDPLASRLEVGGRVHDYYFAGVSSGINRPPGQPRQVSWLQYFGWKNLLLSRQVLSAGEPEPSPFSGVK
jgi:hypothetical protein